MDLPKSFLCGRLHFYSTCDNDKARKRKQHILDNLDKYVELDNLLKEIATLKVELRKAEWKSKYTRMCAETFRFEHRAKQKSNNRAINSGIGIFDKVYATELKKVYEDANLADQEVINLAYNLRKLEYKKQILKQ